MSLNVVPIVMKAIMSKQKQLITSVRVTLCSSLFNLKFNNQK